MIVEGFAGAGGISEALRMLDLGVPVVGYEKDKAACDTARAAGHARIQADVSMLDLRPLAALVVLGYCAGPPCQSYSSAGRQKGRLDRPRIEAHIERIRKAGRWLHYSREGWHDPRSPLVLEPLRFALEVRPEWIVLEQVPQVLPLWELIAEVLREHGWTVDTGVLKAEQYGVAQTRKRAILVASRRVIAQLPEPTHRPYRKGVDRHDGDQRLLPWVSMADALNLAVEAGEVTARTSMGEPRIGNRNGSHEMDPATRPAHVVTGKAASWVLRSNYSDSGLRPGHTAEERGRTLRELEEPATSVTGRPAQWALVQSAQSKATVRTGDEPAPTITAGHDAAERRFVRFGNQEHSAVRDVDEPAATVRFSERINAIDWVGQARNAGPGAQRDPRSLDDPSYTIRANGSGSHPSGTEWVQERPAPTVVGTRRSSEGMLIGRQMGGDPNDASQLPAVRVTVEEAAVLQSFRADYPWQGSKSDRYRQVGDAAPPLLMAAVIAQVAL